MASDLSTNDQLRAALRFFQSKRQVSLSEIEEGITAVRETRVDDTMYNQEDVERLLDAVQESVRSAAEETLKRTVHMNVLLIRQVLEDAEKQGVVLSLNLSKVEDSALLAEISSMRLDVTDATQRAQRAVSKLESLGDERRRLEATLEQAQADNTLLSERLTQLQRKYAEASSELTVLRSAPPTRVVAESKEPDALLDDPTGGGDVAHSKQFMQLKRMMEKKNAQLRELRERLAKYEGDSAPVDEDS